LEDQLSYLEQARNFASDELKNLKEENIHLQTLLSNEDEFPSTRNSTLNFDADGEESSQANSNKPINQVIDKALSPQK